MSLKLDFDHFDGSKPIKSLSYYPFELTEDREVIKKNLIERGEKFRKLCEAAKGSRMFEYAGDAIFVKKGFSGIQTDYKVGPPLIMGYAF
jgi:hypothetical protein